jgi:hypothetical protein
MRSCFAIVLLLISFGLRAQSLPPVPERIVSIDCENRSLYDVLHDISAQGKFEFAWASELFDASKTVTLHEKNITVRRAIYLLFGNSITYKVKNDYVILLAAPAPIAQGETPSRKKEYTISGYIKDEKTGIGISYVSVYDSASLASTLSDYYGFYTLKLNGSTQPVNLKVSREYYSDTAFSVVPSSNLSQDIIIHHLPAPAIIPSNQPKTDSVPVQRNVEEIPFIDSLVGFDQVMQSRNLKEFMRRGGQVSLLPFISTNGKLSGNVVNRFSLNIFGGYTGGTRGLEVGTAFNIDRRNMYGAQFSGGANIVGGNVKGVQAAGAINFTMGSFRGVQLCGGTNFLIDTLIGVQLAGGTNLCGGKIYGGQIAAGMNIALHDLDGFQLSAGANFANGNVKKCQLAAGTNITMDTLKGLQVAAGFNFAKQMNGTQISVLNIAKESEGFQLGILNIADTCNGGVPIGLLSIVRKGMHEIEISSSETFFLNATIRTGVPTFHTILTAGFDPQISGWTFGYGFGHDFRAGKNFNINLDGYVQHYNPHYFAEYTNDWLKTDLLLEWRPASYFGIAAGPVFNYFITGTTQEETQPAHSKIIFSGQPASGYHDYAWIGAKLALRFF